MPGSLQNSRWTKVQDTNLDALEFHRALPTARLSSRTPLGEHPWLVKNHSPPAVEICVSHRKNKRRGYRSLCEPSGSATCRSHRRGRCCWSCWRRVPNRFGIAVAGGRTDVWRGLSRFHPWTAIGCSTKEIRAGLGGFAPGGPCIGRTGPTGGTKRDRATASLHLLRTRLKV